MNLEIGAARREAEEVVRTARHGVQQPLRALDRAIAELEQHASAPAEQLASAVLGAAISLAEVLVGHELSLADHSHDTLLRALRHVPTGAPAVVHLARADYDALTAAGPLPGADGLTRDITLVPDDTLRTGDAIVSCQSTTVDSRLAAAIARLRTQLAAGASLSGAVAP
jgi:flagellar assembly protein FliH